MEPAKSRKQRLRACERVLTEHMEEFVRVGLALKEIRDERLYKEDGFSRFEDYCRKKWAWSRDYADRVISSAELRLVLPTPAKKNPDHGSAWTERSVRELKRLESPTKAKAVAERVVKAAAKEKKELTSSFVRKHVDRELGIDRKPKPKPIPKFDETVLRWTGQLNGMADLLDSVSDEDLQHFGATMPHRAKSLVTAIERVQKSLERIWAALP